MSILTPGLGQFVITVGLNTTILPIDGPGLEYRLSPSTPFEYALEDNPAFEYRLEGIRLQYAL
jgi:hypothetical protein